MTIGARMKLVLTAFTISENSKTYCHCASDRLGGRIAGGDQGSSGFDQRPHDGHEQRHARPEQQQNGTTSSARKTPSVRRGGAAPGAAWRAAVIGAISCSSARRARIDADEEQRGDDDDHADAGRQVPLAAG